MSADTTTAIIALIGATFGGGGLKLIEYFLTRGKDADETATQLRSELRQEATDLRAEMQKLKDENKLIQDDLDNWRQKYYDLLDQFYKIKVELTQKSAPPEK